MSIFDEIIISIVEETFSGIHNGCEEQRECVNSLTEELESTFRAIQELETKYAELDKMMAELQQYKESLEL